MKQIIIVYFFVSLFFYFHQTNSMESRAITVTCPACPTGGTCFATFENLYVPGIISGQDLCISLDAQISGDLTVCGAINSDGAGVFAYSTLTQTSNSAPTFKDIIFTDNGIIIGWTHNPGDTDFVCLQAGNYLIQYDAICRATDSEITMISIIALQNGVEIPGSQGSIALVQNNDPQELTRSFIVSFSANDILTLQFTGGTSFVQLEANSGNSTITIPALGVRPSITLTITKIS